MKQKLLKIIQVTIWLHTDEFIFVWSYKSGNGRQNRSPSAKTDGVTSMGGRHTSVPRLHLYRLGAGVASYEWRKFFYQIVICAAMLL